MWLSGTKIQLCIVAIVVMCLLENIYMAGLELGLGLEDLASASEFLPRSRLYLTSLSLLSAFERWK